MKKEKVLHITSNLSLGGTEKTMQVFATYLDKNLFDVYVCAFFASGPRNELIRKQGIDVLLGAGDIQRVQKYMLDMGITIVHWHGMSYGNGVEHALCIEILRFCREQGILVIETSPFSVYQEDLDELTDIKLCVSHTSLAKLFYKYPELKKSPKKYGYLYNPLDTITLGSYRMTREERLMMRRLLGIQDTSVVLGRVGRANLWKWDDAIIDVTRLLIKHGYDIRVIIRAIPETKIDSIRNLGLEQYFVFLPETIDDAELAHTYQMMDIMLHTSRIGESFGVSLVEGMYFGLPIVTSATDFRDFTLFDRDNSQGEIVRDGTNGYIEQTPESMTQKIVALIEDVHTIEEISKANKKYAEETFGVTSLVQLLQEIYLSRSLSSQLQYNPDLSLDTQNSKRDSLSKLLKINLKALYEKYRYHC